MGRNLSEYITKLFLDRIGHQMKGMVIYEHTV